MKYIVNIFILLFLFSLPAFSEKELLTTKQMQEINNFGNTIDTLISENKTSQALSISQFMISRYPDEPDAYFEYAKTNYHAGNTNTAIEYYNKCLQIDKTYYQSYSNIGFIYFQQKEYKKAIKYYNKAMKTISKSKQNKRQKQDYALMLSNRALAEYFLGNLSASLKDYNNIPMEDLSDYSGIDHIYFNRGLCKYDIGDKTGALEDYNKAKELNPKFKYIYYNHRG